MRPGARLAKHWIGPGLAKAVEWRLRRTGLRAGVAIVYHATLPEPASAPRLAPGIEIADLRSHLKHLTDRYRLVSAGDLVAATDAREPGERFPAAVTFDDDLIEHVRYALPLLQTLAAPATFFVGGETNSAGGDYWWHEVDAMLEAGADVDELIAMLPDGPARGESTSGALQTLAARAERLPPHLLREFEQRLAQLASPADARPGLKKKDIATLVSAGQEVGFHTRHHHLLTGLDDAGLRAALTDGRDELETLTGGRISVIAYPHGTADTRVANAARAAGFRTGFVTSDVAVTGATDPLRAGRLPADRLSTVDLEVALVAAIWRARSTRNPLAVGHSHGVT